MTLNYIEVKPHSNLFNELGNNTYEFIDLLSELIDNAIAAMGEEHLLIKITIGLSNKPTRTFITVRDNARGIPFEKLADAISPGALGGGTSLNEHGLGMKQSIASMGKLEYILTKTAEAKTGFKITRFDWGKIPVEEVKVDWKSGTEIRVRELKPIVNTSKINYTRTYVKLLGARYRRLLRPSAKKMDIQILMVDADNDNQTVEQWDVSEIKPVYFHPSRRQNEPVVERRKFAGGNWEAELTFGYAPTDLQYDELGLPKPDKFHPYHVSMSKQGLDIVNNDRVIQFHRLPEIGLVANRHPDYNYICGEIDLKRGFRTAITKNSIMYDQNYSELLAQVNNFLNDPEKKYIERRAWPEEIPEKVLRNRLAHHLKNRTIDPCKEVVTEFAVQGLGGFIDVLADKVPYEMKSTSADGLDVFQLFAYMDMGNFDKGVLVAADYSTGAEIARTFIEEKHKKTILLAKLNEFPIIHPLNPEEVE